MLVNGKKALITGHLMDDSTHYNFSLEFVFFISSNFEIYSFNFDEIFN